MGQATMQDVSRVAGVSLKTVSRVVNGEPGVHADTAQKVREAIRHLGYQRNEVARSLARGRTKSIALLLPNISNPVYAALLGGVQAVADTCHYTVVLGNTVRDPEREHDYLTLLRSQWVDGALVVGVSGQEPDDLNGGTTGIPLVYLESFLNTQSLRAAHTNVHFDHYQSERLAVEHLLRLGHTHIAYISGTPGLDVTEVRLAGYRDTLRAAGLPLQPSLIAAGDFTEAGGYAATERLLSAHHQFSAICAANDLTAVGALAALWKHHLRVPHDVSVVGLDDIGLAAFTTPSLTTVKLDARELGAIATSKLMDHIEGREEQAPQEVVLDGVLIARDSAAQHAS